MVNSVAEASAAFSFSKTLRQPSSDQIGGPIVQLPSSNVTPRCQISLQQKVLATSEVEPGKLERGTGPSEDGSMRRLCYCPNSALNIGYMLRVCGRTSKSISCNALRNFQFWRWPRDRNIGDE